MNRFVGLMVLASLAACSGSTGPNLSFEGKSTVTPTPPMEVQTVVTVRNLGDTETQISTNNCGQPIRAFTSPLRIGTPAWQSFDPASMACVLVATVATLAPGDYYDFKASGTIPASLPSGVYYLALNVNGRVVPAGQFQK